MEVWQAIVLGFVQGLAEFLPVSSSGHLLLLQRWFGLAIDDGLWFFDIMLHIGTLIPVIIVLWKDVIAMFKKPYSNFGLWVLASIPAGIGLAFSLLNIGTLFEENLWLLGITFLLTAGELVFSEYYSKKVEMLNPINVKTALIMGVGQACGVLPGLSRSGTTLSAGCLAKVERNKNAVFTFIMSIPIIVVAGAWEGIKGITEGSLNIDVLPFTLGMVSAMVTGYIAVRFMLKVIKKANYKWFSLYLVCVSIATFITAFSG